MCGFGGGDSSPPPPPQLPAAPPLEEPMDVIDDVRGVESIITTDGVTGKKKKLIQKRPNTPQEQELLDRMIPLINTTLDRFIQLYNYDPNQVLNYEPFVERMAALDNERVNDIAALGQIPDLQQKIAVFKEAQQTILDDAYARQENLLQQELSDMGYGRGSTASLKLKKSLAAQKAKADQQLAVESEMYGRQLRREDLIDQTSLHNSREQTRQARFNAIDREYALKKERERDLAINQDRALAHNKELMGIASGALAADQAKREGSIAPQLQLRDYEARNSLALGRHQAETNRILGQHQMSQQHYANQQNQRPGFGDTVLNLGGRMAGAYIGGR